MNVINIAIISLVLLSVAVIIIVIIRSLKNVDEKIVEELNTTTTEEKKSFWQSLKGWMIVFFEAVIKRIKNGVQALHSYIIKEKHKSKDEVVRAKEEFIIDDEEDEELEVFDDRDEEESIAEVDEREDDKISIMDEIDDDENMAGGDGRKKRRFGDIFRRKSKKAKKKESSVDAWSLASENDEDSFDLTEDKKNLYVEDVVEVENKEEVVEIKPNKQATEMPEQDRDSMIGVDRAILEKKILQKIDKDPVNLDNYRELGDLYIKMEKFNDALEVFDYVLTISPRDLVATKKKSKIKLLKRLNKS